MIPLTYWHPWTKLSNEEHKHDLRDFSENGAEHLVLTSGLLMEGFRDSAYLIAFEQDMRQYGLDFVDAHAPFGLWSDIGMPDAKWREIMLLRHRTALQFCKRFEVGTMAFHTGNTLNSIFGKELTLDDYYSALISALEILVAEAEKCGVVIALENQWTPLNHSSILLKVMEYFNSPYLGLCYDSGHGNLMEKGRYFPEETVVPEIWNDLGVPVEWEDDILEKFAPWLVNCHLHDNNGIKDEHLLPQQGTVDWKRILNVLENAPKLQNIQNESSLHGASIRDNFRCFQQLFKDFGGVRNMD